MRYLLSSAFVLCFCLSATAEDKVERPKDAVKATIIKVDDTDNKITLRWADKEGKEQEVIFKVGKDVKYYDAANKAVKLNDFKSGGKVFFTHKEGTLKELWME